MDEYINDRERRELESISEAFEEITGQMRERKKGIEKAKTQVGSNEGQVGADETGEPKRKKRRTDDPSPSQISSQNLSQFERDSAAQKMKVDFEESLNFEHRIATFQDTMAQLRMLGEIDRDLKDLLPVLRNFRS